MRSLQSVILFVALLLGSCGMNPGQETGAIVEIRGTQWYINGKVTNQDSPAEGLLMNVRMVNSVFEERGGKMPEDYIPFDPELNADEFISKIPEYTSLGVNGFTISLQGGAPGYEGAVNTAFEQDGTLREDYMNRVLRVVRAAGDNSAVVILSCFYQRQHSHESALEGREAILNAIGNTVNWLKRNKLKNVILEISNEYRHGGYRNWKDGHWLSSTKGQLELMAQAKRMDESLIISTSGMGDGQLNDSLIMAADYISIHFNNTSLEDYERKIENVKKAGKPVLCNEDDKTGTAGAAALLLSVKAGCGWGYMNIRQNQTIPFRFEGRNDDPLVYDMMKDVTSAGYVPDPSLNLH